jgi:hypothetical protein
VVKPKTRLGYYYGVNRNKEPAERAPYSGGEKFAEARVPRRKAGDALGIDLISGTGQPPTLPPPYVGGAELRNLDISGI